MQVEHAPLVHEYGGSLPKSMSSSSIVLLSSIDRLIVSPLSSTVTAEAPVATALTPFLDASLAPPPNDSFFILLLSIPWSANADSMLDIMLPGPQI